MAVQQFFMSEQILKPRKEYLEGRLQGAPLEKIETVKVLFFISQNKKD